MFSVDENFSWKVREKRAKQRLTKTNAANEIGISRKTLTAIENNQLEKISKTVYEKVVSWILKEV